jgi:hypothetical protein
MYTETNVNFCTCYHNIHSVAHGSRSNFNSQVLFKKYISSQVLWLILIVLATWEVKLGRNAFKTSLGKKVRESTISTSKPGVMVHASCIGGYRQEDLSLALGKTQGPT